MYRGYYFMFLMFTFLRAHTKTDFYSSLQIHNKELWPTGSTALKAWVKYLSVTSLYS